MSDLCFTPNYDCFMQEEADGEAQGLQRQLAQMQEVQGQLKSTAEALQGRTELQEQQIEVLRMEVVAKDEANALQQALSHSSAASEVGCYFTPLPPLQG